MELVVVGLLVPVLMLLLSASVVGETRRRAAAVLEGVWACAGGAAAVYPAAGMADIP